MKTKLIKATISEKTDGGMLEQVGLDSEELFIAISTIMIKEAKTGTGRTYTEIVRDLIINDSLAPAMVSHVLTVGFKTIVQDIEQSMSTVLDIMPEATLN